MAPRIPSIIKKGLKKKPNGKKKLSPSRMGPNLTRNRLLQAQLSDLNAIPDSSSFPTPTGGGGGSPSTPATTPEVEMVTQAGAVLQTQAGEDLITQ